MRAQPAVTTLLQNLRAYQGHAACLAVRSKVCRFKNNDGVKFCICSCVWLEYAEEMVRYYESLGKKMELTDLLTTLDDSVDDPMVKAFLRMELKSRYSVSK